MSSHFRRTSSALALIAVTVSLCSGAKAQQQKHTQAAAPDAKSSAALPTTVAATPPVVSQDKGQKDGVPVAVDAPASVANSVNVEGVLLPYNLAKHVFGKEVAEKYAIVSLIVTNRDQKQSLILNTVMLDYSNWLFNGTFDRLAVADAAHIESYQVQNIPSQVASAEVREVRTDFQDAQMFSARNWIIRIATQVGATAASLSYSTASDLYAPSVAAFNGNVVPALAIIWPDNSQTQLNLLNDIGFRTNKVISARSSDVVVAFFPLERFLTPSLAKIYKKAPAAFFNPSELLLENPDRNKDLRELLESIARSGLLCPTGGPSCSITNAAGVQQKLGISVANYEAAILTGAPSASANAAASAGSPGPDNHADPASGRGNFCQNATEATTPKRSDCMAVSILNRVSLNNIRVVIGGMMTLDSATVPATIASVNIANGDQPGTWASGQKVTGTLTGSFLSGGSIVVTGLKPDGTSLDSAAFSAFTPDSKNATDARLPFSSTIGANAIAAGSKLMFTVSKTAQDKTTTISAPFTYTVAWGPQVTITTTATAPTWAAGTTFSGTMSGSRLSGAKLQAVAGGLNIPAGNFTVSTTSTSDTSLAFTVKIGKNAVPAGCTLTFYILSTNQAGAPEIQTATYTVPAGAH